MVQVDVPMALACGAFLTDAASKRLARSPKASRVQVHLANAVFQIFFFSWIPVYFLLNNFGWETTHMWWYADSVTAYPFYVPIFLIVFFLAGIGGCALGIKRISTILMRAGADVTIAENGKEAVERALAEAFDLILMDMQMPELDRYGATRQLRQQGITCPVIVHGPKVRRADFARAYR